MKRKIIKIDPAACTGCSQCIPNCPEGAIQLIDGKARLISDLFCDGLGACIGSCPFGAIEIEEREAETYDEKKVMENIVAHGPNTIRAHLKHLSNHGEKEYLKQALEVLKQKKIAIPEEFARPCAEPVHSGGCPGMRAMSFEREQEQEARSGEQPSALRQWPVQLHLVPPGAAYFQGKDVLLAADCVAYALGNFHSRHLSGKSLAIACPKLDANKEIYVEKIKTLIEEATINTLTVMIMEVPCCSGLRTLAEQARSQAARKVPLNVITVGIQGVVRKDEWI